MKIESNIFKRNFQAFLFYIKNIKDIAILPLIIYLLSFVIALVFQGLETLGVFENLFTATLASIISILIVIAVFTAPIFHNISQINLIFQKKNTTFKKQIQNIQTNFFSFLKQLFFFFKYLLGIPAIVLFIVVIIAYIDPLIGQLLFPIAVIFSGFFTLIRTPKSIFAPILFVTSKVTTKNFIQQSQELTQKKWWKIFGNIIFISLIAGLFNFIFFFGQEGLTYLFPNLTLNEINLLTVILSIYNITTKTFVIGLVITAFYFLYQNLKQK